MIQNMYDKQRADAIEIFTNEVTELLDKLASPNISINDYVSLTGEFYTTSWIVKAKIDPPTFMFETVEECKSMVNVLCILNGFDSNYSDHVFRIDGLLQKSFNENPLQMLNVFVISEWFKKTESITSNVLLVCVNFMNYDNTANVMMNLVRPKTPFTMRDVVYTENCECNCDDNTA